MRFAILLFLSFLPSVALAGWQGYEIGDTYDVVKSKCQKCSASNDSAGSGVIVKLIDNDVVISGNKFKALFLFGSIDNRLSEVKLVFKSGEWEDVSNASVDLIGLIASKYGQPTLIKEDYSYGTTSKIASWYKGDMCIYYNSFITPKIKGKSILTISYAGVDVRERDKI